jgi:hypothetical protein
MKNLIFIEVYKKLPRTDKIRTKTRNEIIKRCGITQSIFYNWYSGITAIPSEFHTIISEILGTPTSN